MEREYDPVSSYSQKEVGQTTFICPGEYTSSCPIYTTSHAFLAFFCLLAATRCSCSASMISALRVIPANGISNSVSRRTRCTRTVELCVALKICDFELKISAFNRMLTLSIVPFSYAPRTSARSPSSTYRQRGRRRTNLDHMAFRGRRERLSSALIFVDQLVPLFHELSGCLVDAIVLWQGLVLKGLSVKVLVESESLKLALVVRKGCLSD